MVSWVSTSNHQDVSSLFYAFYPTFWLAIQPNGFSSELNHTLLCINPQRTLESES